MPAIPEEPKTFSKTLVVIGKTFYKSSLVATLCSDRARKVTMRTLHARGVAIEDLQNTKKEETLDQVDLDGPDLIKSGDIVGVLVCTGNTVALATMEITGFQHGLSKVVHSFVELDSLDYGSDANIIAIGQIIALSRNATEPHSWHWTGNYVKVAPVSPNKYLTHCHLVIEVSGTLIFPLTPSIVAVEGSASASESITSSKLTWSFNEKQLLEPFQIAWQALDTQTVLMLLQILVPYLL
ncbi:hypothetical protein C8J55DRAFT_556304 [Lentinula edodes]|uniref:Uncharacterized protein n=1 Tax=Lentinula lateritia TaxID=40482 RepID=A0A9W9DZL4_9AGAR|nr:hypothetical protein C8J55DRAFT_556304 [Lentinula edodes]